VKHSILVRFITILLTACSLAAAIGGAAGIVIMESAGLYVNGLEALQDQQYDSIGEALAEDYACRYTAQLMGACPESLYDDLYGGLMERYKSGLWGIELFLDGKVLDCTPRPQSWSTKLEYTVSTEYPLVLRYTIPNGSQEDATAPTQPNTAPEPTGAPPLKEPAQSDEPLPSGWLRDSLETVWEDGQLKIYHLFYYPGPEYDVTVYLQEEVLQTSSLHILTYLYPYRFSFIFMLGIGLAMFAGGLVFLLWSAGHTASGQIRPSGLNRLPLDLYALIAATGTGLLIWLFSFLWNWMLSDGPHPGNLSLLGANLLLIVLLVLGLLMALAAQVKLRNGFWWRHSMLGFLCIRLGRGIRFVAKGISSMYRMLSVTWQWLMIAAVMGGGICFAGFLSLWYSDAALLLALVLLCCGGIVLYGGYCFGVLLSGAKRMSEGELDHQIPTKYLLGSFRDFAEELNILSETAVIAARNQTRSERMKTELITNVSHDIKTPLTSIINFVDLLQKPHSPEENAQYLEVLSRQSHQMKRLIEDLMDLSKATTGNMPVSITCLDAAETVNQALGEFSDKLESAGLTPVFRQPDTPIYIAADGRLTWRVLSNVLSNAVKYAMPGTRLYVDLTRIDSQVCLSLKNISREVLHQSAEELMERFVQGDVSRNSEGTGLGLNIAQSLMEVQHGQLQLLLDGDLFKVTLIFPSP